MYFRIILIADAQHKCQEERTSLKFPEQLKPALAKIIAEVRNHASMQVYVNFTIGALHTFFRMRSKKLKTGAWQLVWMSFTSTMATVLAPLMHTN